MTKLFTMTLLMLPLLAGAYEHEFVMQFTGECSPARDTCLGKGPSQVCILPIRPNCDSRFWSAGFISRTQRDARTAITEAVLQKQCQ